MVAYTAYGCVSLLVFSGMTGLHIRDLIVPTRSELRMYPAVLIPKIFEAIEESDLFVLIWSKNARDSKWVKKESRYALRRNMEHGSPDFVPIPVERTTYCFRATKSPGLSLQ